MKQYLSDEINHIKLLFPYIDYGLNILKPELNQIEEYENKSITPKLEEGYILPNNIGKLKLIRETLTNLKRICYFILYSSNEIITANYVKTLISLDVEYMLVDLNDYSTEKLPLTILIIRPDFIIERIIKLE